jgi:hypothetical protein
MPLLFSIKLVKLKKVWLARILEIDSLRDRGSIFLTFEISLDYKQFLYGLIIDIFLRLALIPHPWSYFKLYHWPQVTWCRFKMIVHAIVVLIKSAATYNDLKIRLSRKKIKSRVNKACSKHKKFNLTRINKVL